MPRGILGTGSGSSHWQSALRLLGSSLRNGRLLFGYGSFRRGCGVHMTEPALRASLALCGAKRGLSALPRLAARHPPARPLAGPVWDTD